MSTKLFLNFKKFQTIGSAMQCYRQILKIYPRMKSEDLKISTDGVYHWVKVRASVLDIWGFIKDEFRVNKNIS